MVQEKIKILIVDDHTVVRKGLKSLLSNEKYGIQVVAEAANGEEAFKEVALTEPDVVLMDLVMPEVDGIEAIKKIKEKLPKTRILVLTSFSDDTYLAEAIKAGAYGFLLKDTSPDDLVQTITAVYEGKMVVPQRYASILTKMDRAGEEMELKKDPLTTREWDVIHQIAMGLSNAQIADTLSISVTTVRSHISHMLRKLNLENRTMLALYARDHDDN